MKVEYRTKKLKKQCEDPKTAKKDYGLNIGNRLTQRVGEIIAATSFYAYITRRRRYKWIKKY